MGKFKRDVQGGKRMILLISTLLVIGIETIAGGFTLWQRALVTVLDELWEKTMYKEV